MLAWLTGCGFTRIPQPRDGGARVQVAAVTEGAGSPLQPGVATPEFSLPELPVRDREWQSLGELSASLSDATLAVSAEDDDAGDPQEAGQEHEFQGLFVGPASGLSAAGLATTQNAATVDGLSGWQMFAGAPRGSTVGAARAQTSLGGSAVRMLRSTPRDFSSVNGAAGALLAITTRAGSRSLHGSAFGLLRESGWAAANPFSIATRYHSGVVTSTLVKPQDALGQFGGMIGGGLPNRWLPHALRDRAQGFGSLEEQVRSDPAVSAPASPAFFTLTAMQRAVLAARGVTAAQTDVALGYLDSLMGTLPRSSQRLLGFGRVDLEPGRRDTLSLAWTHDRFRAPAGSGASSRSAALVSRSRSSLGDANVQLDAVSGAWTHLLSRRWTEQLRAQWSHDLEFEQPRAPLPQEPAIAPGGFAPQVSIGPQGFTYGTAASLGRQAYPDEQRVETREDLRGAWGHHAVSVGGDWSRVDDLVASATDVDGSFSYDSGVTNGHAGGLVDWITDATYNVNAYPNAACPSISAATHRFCFRSYSQSFGQQRTEWVTHEVSAWAQDAWRVRDNLRLTAGVRWEYTLLPLPQQPNAALNASLHSAVTANDARLGSTAAFPEDRNNFGPRLAVDWRVAGTDVRVGYGLFFGRLAGATVRDALSETGLANSLRRIRITPTAEVVCPQNTRASFGYPCSFETEPTGTVVSTMRTLMFAQGFRLPAIQRGSLELERSFGRWNARLAYAGAIATQLPGTVDLNLAPATGTRSYVLQGGDGWRGLISGETFAVPLYTARLLPQYGPVSALVSHANASYHSLEAGLRGRVGGMSLRASYTFSRAIDYAPQMGATPRVMTQFDPFQNGYDKGRSSLDFTHRFAGALVWHSPEGLVRPWQRVALSHWLVSAIGTAGSGAPYSYDVFGGTLLSGGRESINGAGGATYLPTVGRNTLRLPLRGTMNLRLARTAEFGRWHMEGFAEAFNALNERNLTHVETRAFLLGTAAVPGAPIPLVFQDAAMITAEGLTAPAFGQPTSSTSGLSRERQVEFGLRLRF